MCETRWTARHTTLEDVEELYPALLDTTQTISESRTNEWSPKAVTEANGLYSQLTSSKFITAFQFSRSIFTYTKPLAALLQGTYMDLVYAYKKIDLVREQIQSIRLDDAQYSEIYMNCEKMADEANVMITKPRTCNRQAHRGNIKSDTPKEHYKRNVFIPFVDCVISQLT